MAQSANRIVERDFPLSKLGMNSEQPRVLKLCQRELALPGQMIQQFWLAKPGLYGTRKRQSGNHAAVLDLFRSLCCADGPGKGAEPAEVHILASLLPWTRSTGAQKVFPDACLKKTNTPSYDVLATAPLEDLLAKSAEKRLTVAKFCVQNRGAVGFPEFSEETFDRYRTFVLTLFGEAIEAWWDDPDAAFQSAKTQWSHWQASIGRHRGRKLEKDVLDILSFESKAAFHQCYSALWVELIRSLAVEQPDPLSFANFHSLWHLDLRWGTQPHPMHLLHGLVFGLHPAFGSLLTTETGRRLVAELIQDPSDIAAHERFLHAGLVSLHQYAGVRAGRMN